MSLGAGSYMFLRPPTPPLHRRCDTQHAEHASFVTCTCMSSLHRLVEATVSPVPVLVKVSKTRDRKRAKGKDAVPAPPTPPTPTPSPVTVEVPIAGLLALHKYVLLCIHCATAPARLLPCPADVSDTGCVTVAVPVPPADIVCFVPVA